MSYIKNVWANGDKVTAKKLNNIENGIEELDNKTKIVEKGFKEFQIGDRFQSGYELTIDNSNGVVPSKTYYFYAYNKNGEYLEAFDLLVSLIKDSPIQFQWGFEATGENFITNAVIFGADPEDISTFISEIAYYELVDSSSVSGSGLLGGYGETQLTLQNVYDNTKVVEEEFKEFKSGAVAGTKFKVGDKITLDNVLDKSQNSLGYYFVEEQGINLDIHYNYSNETFMWVLTREDGTTYENEGLEYVFEYDMLLEEAVNDYDGNGLLGTWTEKQLTAQEVYDKLNTGIGYKTAKVVVEEVDNSLYNINLPEAIDMINGSLLIKKSNNNILTCKFIYENGAFGLRFFKEYNEIENISFDGFTFGNSEDKEPNYITLSISGGSDFNLRHGEEIEIMYFVSPFAQLLEN